LVEVKRCGKMILVVSNREMKGRYLPTEHPHHIWEHSQGILSSFFTGGSYWGLKEAWNQGCR